MSIKEDFPHLNLRPTALLWIIEGQRSMQRQTLALPKETLEQIVSRLLPELVIFGVFPSQALTSKKPIAARFQISLPSSEKALPWDQPLALLRLPSQATLLLRRLSESSASAPASSSPPT